MSSHEHVRYFQKLELFRDLSLSDLEKFLAECREETFEAGRIVFQEGDLPDRFYLLLDGEVEIWKDYSSPYADILAVRGKGASFGEMSLIDDLPRSATVKTKTIVKVLSLDKIPFRKIIAENPSIALLIMKTVSHMVRVSNETFQNGLRQKNQKLEKAYEDLKLAQAELIRSERLSTLGKFASMIIHDLRNPISVVKGYAEMLTLGQLGQDKITLMTSKLLSEVERLNRMVGELLDYSRGNIRLNLSPVFLHELFQRLQEQHQQLLQNRHIEFHVENTVTEPLLLDQDRILRVFSNLIDNAKKAMRQGGTITLKAQSDSEHVTISIADTGEGMPPEVREKLFEPFFSASSAGGTGLGMLVVSNVVEAHQGTITVDSVPHEGTTIKITLPCQLGGLP